MKVKEVAAALERFAPLPLQESYDNAGLQIGLTEGEEVSGVVLCLDVTEDVVDEAIREGCNLIVAHHPLLFRGVKRVDTSTTVTRCIHRAIRGGVAIYAAHTNLDNARGGVNWRIAERLGLERVDFLEPQAGGAGGSGLIGVLPTRRDPMDFLREVKEKFHVDCLMHNAAHVASIGRVALCGGAGEFLLDAAVAKGADVFITGEMGYHHYFGYGNRLLIATIGHYQSEQFTIGLLRDILREQFPDLKLVTTRVNTNPIHYLF